MNTDHKYDLSIIVPCYNEFCILKDSVREIIKVMNQTKYTYEIIFVDDKSGDGTQRLIKEIIDGNKNMRCIFHSENSGRGGAVVDGFKVARGDIAGFLDIDLEVHARYILSMVIAIKEEGYDMATAYRVYKITLSGMLRHILSFAYRRLVRFFVNLPLKDTETGFKFFKREKILPILEKTQDKGWFWDTEISYLAYRNNMRIKEIPCLFIRRRDKASTVNLFKDSVDYLIRLIAFKRRIK